MPAIAHLFAPLKMFFKFKDLYSPKPRYPAAPGRTNEPLAFLPSIDRISHIFHILMSPKLDTFHS